MWPIWLLMNTKQPPAASTSGATSGIACIAPHTLVRITRSKSSREGGCLAPPRDMTPATYSAMSIFSP